MHPSITLDRIMEAVDSGDFLGFCVACGAEADGIDPDARRVPCEACDAPRVYGAEELLLMVVA